MERIELEEKLNDPNLTREKIFKVIADIPSYPEFVPGYKKVEVLEKRKDYIKVRIIPTIPISPMIMEAKFYYPEKIKFKLLEGPLDIFEGEWHLYDDKVKFYVNYFVKSWLKRKLIYKFVKMSCNDIVYSFKLRTKRLLSEGKL